MSSELKFTCPVCGWDKLDCKPYENMPPLSQTHRVQPPYENVWGFPSYEVCECCGFEFGNDDNGMDASSNFSFESYLREWFDKQKCEWFTPSKKPDNWSLIQQLENAGLDIPPYIRATHLLKSSN